MSHISKLLCCILFFCSAASATAADYVFAMPRLQMQVWVHRDASVGMVYDITFANSRQGRPIDVVDIGTPHSGYSLASARASLDGVWLNDIRPSTVVSPGFEVHLDAQTIPRGESGTLHVEFPMPNMVWQDTTRADLASLQVVPVWFGAQYLRGDTQLEVAIHLPPGVKPDEVLWQHEPFSHKAVVRMAEQPDTAATEHVVVAWARQLPLTRAYKFGVSFPKRDLERVMYLSPLGLAMKWFRESSQARLIAGVVFLLIFALLFFRFSGGTGISVFVLLAAGAVVMFVVSPELHLLSFPVVVLLIGVNEWLLGRRKSGYMPPIASIEGGGIKRGLTAPEAAAILELPLSKVLGLVIFGLLKKGVLRQVQADPLTVEVDEAFRLPEGTLAAGRAALYREAAQRKAVVVHSYEFPFLPLIQDHGGKPTTEIDFGLPLKQLLEQTARRMAGFDLGQTRDYYRAIVRRAAEQAGAVADIPQREQQIDRNFEWILLDPHYPTVFDYGRPYRPIWSRRAAPVGGGVGTPSTPATPSTPGQTTLGDVAASFAGWAENTMGKMASAVSPAALNVPKAGGGFVNLTTADWATGELFKSLAEASAKSGHSGGGGGCACACAGCACACACAGGGR